MSVGYRLWLLWLLATPTLAQEPGARAWFDRDSIYEGQSVTLTIEVDDPARGVALDTAPLLRDFQVLTRQTGSFLRQVNGQMTTKTQWLLHLQPRRAGELTVPALSIGAHRTQALTLRVEAAPAGDADAQGQDVLLEIEAEPRDPYVQSQVRLTVRLLLAAPLLQGGLEEPDHPDATVEKLGADLERRTTRQGRNYQVIERRYALFPEKSGDLTLPSLRFRGRVGESVPGRSRYLNRGRQTEAVSDPLTLEVRPRPTDYSGDHWLPAASLGLREAWPEEPPRFRVGEPVTRKLIVESKGLRSAQLPELAAPAGDRFRIYPEQPVIGNRVEGEWVIGRRELSMALVPTEPGRFLLPELRLVWWDTVADREQVAVLPEREITVDRATDAPPPPPPAAHPAPPDPAVETTPPIAAPVTGLWPWLAGGLGLLWLLTLGLWWRERRRQPPPPPAATAPPQAAAARRALARACRDHDPQRAAAGLLAWAAATWPGPPPRNLGELADRLAMGGETVRALDRALYAPDGGGWRGETLWGAVRGGLQARTDAVSEPPSGPLPPLYSQHLQSIR